MQIGNLFYSDKNTKTTEKKSSLPFPNHRASIILQAFHLFF